jgi:Holliday junction resolvase
MSRSQRDKGAQFERDVQDLARAHGFTACRRAFASGAQGGADLTGIPGVALECKRQETVRLREWWAQAEAAADPGEVPVVALRWSRGPALAVLPLEELLALLRLREAA